MRDLQQRVASLEKELALRHAAENLLRSELAGRSAKIARFQSSGTARGISQFLPAALRRLLLNLASLLDRQARFVAGSGMFDAAWYLKRNPDVAAACMNPVQHFLRFGAREGRYPHPLFDTHLYLEWHPEVAASGVNPLVHYLQQRAVTRRSPAKVAFPCEHQPLASIVIPVHGNSRITYRCLDSIASTPTRIPYEVIVIDDASPDATAAMLAGILNLRVVTNPTNLGYLRSCNAGAALAKGRYVVMLNNDTEVQLGWLDALVGTVESDPAVGVVGAKLIYPKGTLQEAGGIIFSDGTGWNYGRNGDSQHYEFNHVREVDYCSGACLLVRTELWRKLGGYDERFSPAYYEDTDLCFAARACGFRVIYQPKAVIMHHEGASHGTDKSSGIKRYQEVNRQAFRDKWAAELVNQSPPGAKFVRQARERRRGPGVLVIDHTVPTPDRDAGSLRMSLILKTLVDFGCLVRFLPADQICFEPYTSQIGQLGVEVIFAPDDLRDVLHSLDGEIAVTIVSRPTVALRFLPLVREVLPGSKVVYDMVDCHSLRESRRGEICVDAGATSTASASHDLEFAAIRAADLTIAVTDHEKSLVLAEAPGTRISVIPTIHGSPRSKAPFAERDGLLFVGNFNHLPNEDAMLYFHDQILPLIRERLPGVTLHLVGSPVLPTIQALASPTVQVHGWVKDLAALHERCRVFIAPLRYGAGMKGKIGDSMVRGVPVVTTSVGAEGMELANGVEVLIADEPQSFADAVVRLSTDEALWRALAENGALHIAENFGTSAASRRIAALLEELGVETPRELLPLTKPAVTPGNNAGQMQSGAFA